MKVNAKFIYNDYSDQFLDFMLSLRNVHVVSEFKKKICKVFRVIAEAEEPTSALEWETVVLHPTIRRLRTRCWTLTD